MIGRYAGRSTPNAVIGECRLRLLATAVIVPLSFEAAALILLLGAQVIVEFERRSLDAIDEDGKFHA